MPNIKKMWWSSVLREVIHSFEGSNDKTRVPASVENLYDSSYGNFYYQFIIIFWNEVWVTIRTAIAFIYFSCNKLLEWTLELQE